MGLYKRGRVWHFEFQLAGKRYRGTTGQTSKAAAADFERAERARLSVARGEATLGQAAASWWSTHAKFLKSAQVIAADLETCRRLIDFDQDVRDVTTLTIKQAVARRRGETTQYGKLPSNATVNREIPYVVRPILKHAATVLDVRAMPTIDWRQVVLRKVKPRVRELNDDTRARLFETLLPHYHDLLEFYLTYGVRWKEAFFPPEQLDIVNGRIYLRERKGGDWHTLPILNNLRPMLAARKSRAEAAGLPFIWYRDGRDGLEAIQPRAFQSAMQAAVKKMGVSMRCVHDLRHDAAMQAMRRSGGNMRAVQRMLGQESIQSTAVYAHAIEDDVLEALGEPKPSPHKKPTDATQPFDNKRKRTNT